MVFKLKFVKKFIAWVHIGPGCVPGLGVVPSGGGASSGGGIPNGNAQSAGSAFPRFVSSYQLIYLL